MPRSRRFLSIAILAFTVLSCGREPAPAAVPAAPVNVVESSIADLRKAMPGDSCETQLRKQFERAGFVVDHHEDITSNAVRSLDELRELNGGRLWDEFESLRDLFGRRVFEYHYFLLRKPAPPAS